MRVIQGDPDRGARTGEISEGASPSAIEARLAAVSAQSPRGCFHRGTWTFEPLGKPARRDLLFIGHADFSNAILLALAGKHRGQVWFMLTGDDARPDDANPRVAWHDRRDMRKVADSFEQVMRSLRPLSSA